MHKLITGISFVNEWSLHEWVLLVAVIALSLFFSFYRFSVPTPMRTRLLLAILRTAPILIILFIILDPYWRRPQDSDWIGVLVDTSESMGVVDEGGRETRIAQLKRYFETDAFWSRLEKNRQIKVFGFDSALADFPSVRAIRKTGGVSRLFSALDELNRRYGDDPNLLGWIVFSDGNATDFSPQQERIFRELAFPCMAVALGEEGAVSNITLRAPALRDWVFVGEILPVKAEWDSARDEEGSTFLKVRVDGRPFLNREVGIGEGAAEFEMSSDHLGEHLIEMEMEPLKKEGSEADNAVRVWVGAVPRHIRVYYAESFYKDENLFQKALEEDADFKVDFSTSLIGFAQERAVPYFRDPLYGFPTSREELLQYDVIVLSDVKRGLLEKEQIGWIRELVESGGGALVMIGGVDSFGDGGYVGTEIEKMLPVEISEEYKKDIYLVARGTVENPLRPLLAKSAQAHPIVTLSEDEEENSKWWETMPLLGGYNYVGRVKPGAVAILQHPVDKSAFGPRIILAVQNYGRGKVLAFTSDVTYNWGQWFQAWRSESNEWLFAKFWRNALKWLSENRLRERSSPIEVEKDPPLIEASQPFRFTVRLPHVLDERAHRVLRLDIFQDDKSIQSREFKGFFADKEAAWEVRPLAAGDYLLKIFYEEKNKVPVSLERPFSVHPSRIEARHLEVNHKLLQDLAKQTEGVYLTFSEMDRLEGAMTQVQKVRLRQSSIPFWDQIWIYLTVLTFLFLDWFIRKRRGLE